MKIPITKHIFDNFARRYIQKPLESGWLVQGHYVAEFERLFSRFVGSKFAKAASNCTAALHLGLEALGIKRGDRVIVPSFTYVASANAVEYTGAEVVFCDIDLRTFNIDVNHVEDILKKDRKKTIKAVMPVNLFGLCADLPQITKLAQKYNLRVIEDSACGLGAYINQQHSGTFGDVGCFSFHPRKLITTGEGGMLVTNNERLAAAVACLRDHGASKSDLQRQREKGGSLLPEFNVKGFNYRMTDMQGALGVAQMRKVERLIHARAKIAEAYDGILKGIPDLMPPTVPATYTHGYQSYVCIFTAGELLVPLNIKRIHRLNKLRNTLMFKLEEKGISTRQGTHAIHTLGYYRKKFKFNDQDYLCSYAADRLSIALPLYAQMSDEEFKYVATNLRSVLKEMR